MFERLSEHGGEDVPQDVKAKSAAAARSIHILVAHEALPPGGEITLRITRRQP